MSPLERIRRIRTGWGFGVHSPFAFWLLTEVIRGRYAYYGYEEIEEALERHPKEGALRSHCLLLLRLAGRLAPETAVLPCDCPAAVRTAVKGAGKKIRILSQRVPPRGGRRMLLWSVSKVTQATALQVALGREGSVIVVFRPDSGVKEEIWDKMSCGLLVDGGSVLIAVVKEGLQKACYEILL